MWDRSVGPAHRLSMVTITELPTCSVSEDSKSRDTHRIYLVEPGVPQFARRTQFPRSVVCRVVTVSRLRSPEKAHVLAAKPGGVGADYLQHPDSLYPGSRCALLIPNCIPPMHTSSSPIALQALHGCISLTHSMLLDCSQAFCTCITRMHTNKNRLRKGCFQFSFWLHIP